MTEKDPLQNFEAEYSEGLGQIDDLIEMGFFDSPLALDPASLGTSERTYEELSGPELEVVRKAIFNKFNVQGRPVREYASTANIEARVPGEINVSVYETNIPNMFLQELKFSDDQKRWVFGPDENI